VVVGLPLLCRTSTFAPVLYLATTITLHIHLTATAFASLLGAALMMLPTFCISPQINKLTFSFCIMLVLSFVNSLFYNVLFSFVLTHYSHPHPTYHSPHANLLTRIISSAKLHCLHPCAILHALPSYEGEATSLTHPISSRWNSITTSTVPANVKPPTCLP